MNTFAVSFNSLRYDINLYCVNSNHEDYKQAVEKNVVARIDFESLESNFFLIPLYNFSLPVQDGERTINCYYKIDDGYEIVTWNDANLSTIIITSFKLHVKSLLVNCSDASNSTGMSYLSRQPFPANAHQGGVIYSTTLNLIAEIVKKKVPQPLCKFYSDPAIRFYSKTYQYANSTRTPNCSHPVLVKQQEKPIGCSYHDHTECAYFEQNKQLIKTDCYNDNVESSQVSKYELYKSIYNNSSVVYLIMINDKIHNQLTYFYNFFSEIDEVYTVEAIKEYENVIRTTSNNVKVESLVDSNDSKKNSYLLNLVS